MRQKRQKLSRLTIGETALVDEGAGRGVNMLLMKRDDEIGSGENIAIKLRKNALREAEVEAYMKREFTDEQRKQMTAVGHAMPDGSYPIGNTKDLKNAVQAIGRAKDPKKTKAHIIRRARELGATRHLPDKWVRKSFEKSMDFIMETVSKSEGGESFNTELAEMKSLDYAEGMMEAIHDASHAMKHSIESIMDDNGTADKGAALRSSYAEFLDHVQGLAPQGDVAKVAKRAKEVLMANTFRKAYESVGQSDSKDRKSEINEKTGKLVTVDDDEQDPHKDSPASGRNATEKKALKKAMKWKQRFENLLRMAKADKDARDYLDNPDCDMDEDVKKQFIDMSKAERHAYMDANPINEMTIQKKMEGMPDEVRKAWEAGKEAQVKLEKKEAAEQLEFFTKAATDARLPKELGAHLVTLNKAAPEACREVMKAVAVMSKSVRALEDTGYIFKEFGSRQATEIGGATAYEQLMAKAQDMADEGKILVNGQPATVQQCFSKLFESRDESIREIVKRGKEVDLSLR